MFALRQISFVVACAALALSIVSIDGVNAGRRSLRTAGSVSDDLKAGDVGFVFGSDSGSYEADTSASSSFDGSFDGSWGSFDGSYAFDDSWSGSEGSSSSFSGEEIEIVFP